MKTVRNFTFLFVSLFFFAASTWAEPIAYNIPDSAELNKLSMYMKNIRSKSDQKAVVFEIDITNNDSVAHMYSVTVIMPEAGGAESFIPEKGEGKIAPGESGTTTLGIIWPQFPEEGYTIMVREITER